MWTNYVKIIIRNLKQQRLYASINIAGLAVGMACCMLIMLYIQYELSYDRFHQNSLRIFRVTKRYDTPNGYNLHFARCPDTWVNLLPAEFPEIESLIRFQHWPLTELKIGEHKFRDRHFFTTDANVFDVFSFPFKEGDARTALQQPNSIVLTEEMAHQYFGDVNPIGKTVTVVEKMNIQLVDYRITGVMKNVPNSAHFQIHFLASFSSPEQRQGWAYTYLLLKPGTDPQLLEAQFPDFIRKHDGDDGAKYSFLHLQALTDIHLKSHLDRELEPNGDITYVYIFFVVAVLIILIACINFMNLATARSTNRTREVGIRKVLGSPRHQLIRYFLGESLLFAFIAFIMALIFVLIFLPVFNSLTAKSLSLHFWHIVFWFIPLTILVGIFAGSYPAFILSAVQPVAALKNGIIKINGHTSVRKCLVLAQFAISIALIICAMINYHQFQFLKNMKLGFSKNQIIAIRQVCDAVKKNYATFKNELLNYSGIVDVSASMEEPSRPTKDGGWCYAEGFNDEQDAPIIYVLPVDRNFIQFMEMELIAGQDFINDVSPAATKSFLVGLPAIKNYINNANRFYILNETAVKTIGWKSPEEAIGKMFSWRNSLFELQRGPIVGVVKDFHYASLRDQITATVLFYEPLWFFNFLVKIHPDQIAATLSQIEHTWNKVYPNYPFEYDFVDDLFAALYRAEQRQGQMLASFSIIAIFIAYLGLLGMTSFSTVQRTKEIGVRKILGASIMEIVFLLSKEFARWIMLANLIAWPVAWYFMNKWLQNFAYHIHIDWWLFFIAGLFAFVLAVMTVGCLTFKAAIANPMNALRYE